MDVRKDMPYTVQALAKLAGVTPRTLRFYDRSGLLTPQERGKNGYRLYGASDLLRLQQILFFRELDFSLKEIKQLLTHPSFDLRVSLASQAKLLQLKKTRLARMIHTIHNTIATMEQQTPVTDADLYAGLSTEEIDAYKHEAKERWGHTDAYKQSQARVKNFTKQDWAEMQAATDANLRVLVVLMTNGLTPENPETQAEIANHFAGINRFYDCTAEIYHGLADMYVADERFSAFYAKYHPELPAYLSKGMHAFATQMK